MKTPSFFLTLTAAFAILFAAAALAHGPQAGTGYGPQAGAGYGGPGYMMGQGYMMGPGNMMGPGYMMGHMGYGPQANAPCWTDGAWQGTPLDVDSARAMLEKRLAFHGNDRLKVGDVREAEDDTIVAEIVTVDGSLVEKITLNKQGGWRRMHR